VLCCFQTILNESNMATESYQQQINNELKSMDQRLYDLEEKMSSIDGKLTQVVDAILGNPLTKSGGFVDKIEMLEEKITLMEKKIEKQEEFRRRITWTIGIVIAIAAVLQYVSGLLSNIN
jgi:tetrahydromethanopterin S-methyltransferase subunit G